MKRFCALPLLLFIAVLTIAHSAKSADAPPRDWSAHPAIIEINTTEDIYALGDIHGDYERMAEILAAAKLIDDSAANPAKLKWTGGKSLLVITGDFIDKYDRSLDVIAALRSLQTKAHEAGGSIIITMGNHEAEFLAGSTKKKSASVAAKLFETDGKGKKAPTLTDELVAKHVAPADLIAGTDEDGIGQFLRELPIAAKVNDWFFCHAGNTHGSSLPDLRQQLMSGIDADGFGSAILSDPDSILEARMHPDVWWEKDSADKHDTTGQALRDNLTALGCRHLVFGHQPAEAKFADGFKREAGEMFSKFDGLVFMIDTGLSRGATNYGRGTVLRIHPDKDDPSLLAATAIYSDGKTDRIWTGKR